jgi:hypothetical protein
MPTKEEVVSEIEVLAAEVTAAREGLLKGQIINIPNIKERLDVTCQDAVELEPEEAISLRPQLDVLLEDLRTFAAEVAYIQEKVAAIHKQEDENSKET